MQDERPNQDLLSMALLMAAAPPAPRDPGKPRTQHDPGPSPTATRVQKRS